MSYLDAIVAFVPQISQLGGKRKRDGHLAPGLWTVEELTRQHGEKSVKILRANRFVFREEGLYQEGLAFELMPWSRLHVSECSSHNIRPFAQSAKIQNHPAFTKCLRWFVQDSVHVGDRVLIVLGEHASIISQISNIRDDVTDVVIQNPKPDLSLMIVVALCHLIPHFLAEDHIKDRWSDCFGMVITADPDAQ